METFDIDLIISLSILSGIYLERGRKWYIKRRRDNRNKKRHTDNIHQLMNVSEKIITDAEIRRQHAMEDCIKFPDPGESVTVPFEDQLKDAQLQRLEQAPMT